MTVRLKDIASDLNLSKMTISKVLRGQTDISAATKARVLQRMKELNYRPNIAASSLRTGNTFSIGLVIPSLEDPFFTEIARGLVQTIRAKGYSLLISSAEEDPEIERREIELQLSRQVDALLVASVQESPEFFTALGAQKAPIILIDRKLPSFAAPFIGVRDQEIGYIAAVHLIKAGCSKPAYLRGPRTAAADLRYSGYRAALHEFNILFRPALVVEATEMDRNEYRRGYDAMNRLQAGRIRPDGVMCYTDLIALGVIDAALEKNLRVPEDIAVVGCGNLPSTREMRVPLSSVDLSGLEVGQRTAKLVLRALSADGVAPSRDLMLSPKMIVRRSSQS
ncbi:MAG: transcriptional regulator, LacI family [Edaphobacter sp.]|nr:transcriptional regulator, LacI family [Edaphobacter sp.]